MLPSDTRQLLVIAGRVRIVIDAPICTDAICTYADATRSHHNRLYTAHTTHTTTTTAAAAAATAAATAIAITHRHTCATAAATATAGTTHWSHDVATTAATAAAAAAITTHVAGGGGAVGGSICHGKHHRPTIGGHRKGHL